MSSADPVLGQLQSGYRFRSSDARFAGLRPAAVADCLARQIPLGVDPGRWATKVADLVRRLSAAGYADWDARLQGTMAFVESGNPDKPFPQSTAEARAQITAAYTSENDRRAARGLPRRSGSAEIERGVRRWRATYGRRAANDIPPRHFTDSRYTLTNRDLDRSDLDVQLSSQSVSARIEAAALQRLQGMAPELARQAIAGKITVTDAYERAYNQGMIGHQLRHPKYGFYDDALVAEACPELIQLQDEWSADLDREVVIKVFPASGPPLAGTRFDDKNDWIMSQFPTRSQL